MHTCTVALAILFCFFVFAPREGLGLTTAAVDVVYLIPVYEWSLVWKDWRNPNHKMGSIWRPKMIQYFNKSDFPGEMNRRIDGYDVRNYISKDFDVAYLGDVFMQGHGSRSFDPCTYHVIKANYKRHFLTSCTCVCVYV